MRPALVIALVGLLSVACLGGQPQLERVPTEAEARTYLGEIVAIVRLRQAAPQLSLTRSSAVGARVRSIVSIAASGTDAGGAARRERA